MNLKDVLTELQETELQETIQPFWDQAMAAYPPKGISFLDPQEFQLSREYAGFTAEVDPLLSETAARIRDNPALSCMAWYIYWRTFECSDRTQCKFPKMEHALGKQAGVFHLLLGLAWIPRLRAYHRTLGLPEDVTHETAQQVRCFSINYHMAHAGRLGLVTGAYYWLRNYLADNLYFRIGRFEYWLNPCNLPHIVYRHRRTGQVVALAGEGIKVMPDGFVDGLSDVPDPAQEWVTALRVTDIAAMGNPISPRGIVRREEVRLPLSEWVCVLKKGDIILGMHIPAGGNMAHAKCGESMRQARDFFRRYYPEKSPVAFVCGSWMLSPLLERILPPTANLVQYLRELYLFPHDVGGSAALEFIFFQEKFDAATAPRQTSLQRAVLEYLQAGHVWHNGGMFMLLDDVDKFGTQYYRSHEWSLN
ncbi:MAG: DUF5596 domain-containing protein [Verrucomicrobia bacterium]|nr:DUF5596 domain-containing protein [Verrucomicrobiota bacterium]MBU1735723.1 DUF5596 domain-containing protein [Verrucomicrobiota bacterium]MBU1857567.1 DUF5596 domain-containing protein [Verrucomicrobiota bacterium]